MVMRCGWCEGDPLYERYHDAEWGVPQRDPLILFENLMLEAFQAGLSWITILRKRESFRAQFEGFDPEKLAMWNEENISNAMQNPGIIRHRGKIEATVTAARLYLDIESREGFAPFLWQFTEGRVIQPDRAALGDVPAQTPEAVAMSKALKSKGFKFCGPVICYAFMQAVGMVNDHVTTCHRHAPVKALSTAG
ncbi:MAG: DNA-3-methyladenine glycosylase I [Paracoccus sp. (in: a-proteobacteria)]|nr:DNA-3-methyladenine glycosylase I [Paracoccus sp. (in: a-proteobacteria)]